MEQLLALIPAPWRVYIAAAFTIYVGVTALGNLVIDQVFKVPADHSAAWDAWNLAHPRAAGVVNIFRGGVDLMKKLDGFKQAATGDPTHDCSAKPAEPPAPAPGGQA